VVIDAAHEHFYACGYDKDKNVTLAPCYLSREEVEKMNLPTFGFEQLSLANYSPLNVCECLQSIICGGQLPLSDDIEALYVRKSQAEEGRKC
jgi:hypothetical protein